MASPTLKVIDAGFPDSVYKIIRQFALELGLKIGAHALTATAATNALDRDANITKVHE